MSIKRDAIMEVVQRLHCPVSDGSGVQFEIEWQNEGPNLVIRTARLDAKQNLRTRYIAQTDDMLTAAEFFLACARMCQMAGKQHAERLEDKA